MKKWIALLLAGVLMLSCLAGCGGDKTDAPAPDSGNQSSGGQSSGGQSSGGQTAEPDKPAIPDGVDKDLTV